MINQPTLPLEQPRPANRLSAWYQRDRSAILAAAWTWLLFFLANLAGLVALPACLAGQIAVSLAAGMLAAHFERRAGLPNPNYARMGTLAGFYVCATNLVAIFILAALVGLATLGATALSLVGLALSAPLLLGLCSFSSYLGALAYKKVFVRN